MARWRTLRTLVTIGCFLIGTLMLWRTFGGRQDTPTLAQVAPPVRPTSVPATAAPIASTAASLAIVAPTRTPIIIPTLAGAAPKGSDCPADHPVKGNIRDRSPNKGERIYHLPGDNGYAQTKPERCFADAAAAEAAGYRAVK